jgi:hypothetical protein
MLWLSLAACATAPYSYEPKPESWVINRAQSQESGMFKVRASVPSNKEAEQLFGIPLSDRGIQAVWLEVTNNAPERARLVPYSIDDGYFPPHEVAYMYRKRFSKQGWLDMEQRFYDMTIPRHIAPGATEDGWVFTHNVEGTKAFNVDVFYTGGSEARNESFTFFIEVPGLKPDHAEIDFRALYPSEEVHEVEYDGFRALLNDLPCCTSNQDGGGHGQPVNIVLVATGRELLQALLRADWNESIYERSEKYLEATDYLFGRPPDAIFRKGRGGTTLSPNRNEMGVWLAPILVKGKPVWMAQIKHAIGRRFEIGEMFLTVRLDPDVDDGRNYLLQNLWYSQSLALFAQSASGTPVPRETPAEDFKGSPFFTDGYRFVLWVSGDPVALDEAQTLDWDHVLEDSR